MTPRINIVTLGVSDIASATIFYEKLGFVKSQAASNPSVTFFKGEGCVLGLFGKDALIKDACVKDHWTGRGGISLAQNLESEKEVDAFIALAEKSGAKLLKAAIKTFWGGYSGYFADPDGHVWEIAHNPFFKISDRGLLELPD